MIIRICFGKKFPPWDIGSKILMWAEKFPASHVWIEIENSYSCFVYESVAPKSRRIEKSDHQKHYMSVKEFNMMELNDDESYIARSVINEMMNIKYGFWQILIIGLGLISKTFARWSGRILWNGKKKVICTELAGRFMEAVFKVDFGEKPDTISLRDVYRECLRIEVKREV